MIDEDWIKSWQSEGTITKEQAKKMLADISKEKTEDKSNKFISIIALIGSVLIFIGLAWMVARNWHQIPDALKILILLGSSLGSFALGVLLRQKNQEGIGRSLITLGALLYILSLFLISQIYHMATTTQHYSWILFLSWTVILSTAYLLKSPENTVVSMLVFFPWMFLQYTSSVMEPGEGMIIGYVLMFLSTGALLYGLSLFHSAIKNSFTRVYRYWTVLYFMIIFYLLSFQSFLPTFSKYSFESGIFSPFLVLFVILSFSGLTYGVNYALKNKSCSYREIYWFIGILAVILALVLLTKIGDGATSGYIGSNLPASLWLLWLLNNFVFIGFIIVIILYGQSVGSARIVNLSINVFILEVISRYIGFWMNMNGYFAFSILSILGGVMLIYGAWQIPKWKKRLLEKTNPKVTGI